VNLSIHSIALLAFKASDFAVIH